VPQLRATLKPFLQSASRTVIAHDLTWNQKS
jgi:hypothetical protein